MNEYSFADQLGYFTGSGFTGPERLLPGNIPPGCIAIPGKHDHLSRRIDLQTGEVIPYQPPPPPDTDLVTWVWDNTVERYMAEPTIAARRLEAWARIKKARVVAETAPVEVGGRVFDADPQSQLRISGAVQMAQLAMSAGYGEVWSIDWTLADNTSATLTAREAIDLGLAVAAQVSASHARSRLLRNSINAATTPDELAAITWD